MIMFSHTKGSIYILDLPLQGHIKGLLLKQLKSVVTKKLFFKFQQSVINKLNLFF